MKYRLTERVVKNLPVPPTGSKLYFDTEARGLALRITSHNVRAFCLDYTFHGRSRRMTIGRWPELSTEAARSEALALRRQIREGVDPLEQREAERTEGSVAELSERYLEEHARKHKRPSSVKGDERMIEANILPWLGKLRVSAVGRHDIERLHGSMVGTPYLANRVLALLSTMFAKAVEWGWVQSNPAKGVKRFREEKREAWLDGEQFARLLRACDHYRDQDTADAVRLLAFTGSRAGEVLRAEWPEFDLERAVWVKPSHHTKQRKIEHLPLNELALELLRRRARHKGSVYVFPGRNGRPRASLKRGWAALCIAAGLTREVQTQGKRGVIIRHKPLFRLHDLRHSFASHLVSNGVGLQVVGKLLGHTQAKTTERYAHVADNALREASERFGVIIIGGKEKAKAGG